MTGGRRAGAVPLVLALSLALLAAMSVRTVGQRTSSEADLARQILDATGVKGGLIVHVGCGDGKLTAALRANEKYLVHGLDLDAGNVERARAYIRAQNLYGPVSVEQWTGNRLPYTDNLVNLIVGSQPAPMEEVMRVLAPNGVAYVNEQGKWTKTVKPRPKETDEWTHFLHDADNNAVSNDTVVGPPHHLQWVGGPQWARSHEHQSSVSAVVASGGRIFYVADQGPTASVTLPARWTLIARDAYNGVLLWEKPVGAWEGHLRGFRSGPAYIARRLVAVGDTVYVTLGYGQPVTALDAATGQVIRTYEGTEGTAEIVYRDGVLYLVAGEIAPRAPDADPKGPVPPVRNRRLLAVNADSGQVIWRKADADTNELMPTTLAVAGGRVFFENTENVVCLDAQSAKEIWRAPRPVSLNRPDWSAPTLVVYGDVVLSGDRAVGDQQAAEAGGSRLVEWIVSSAGGNSPVGELIAFSAKDGARLWSCPCRECYNAPVDVLAVNGLVWTGDLVRASDPGFTAGRDVRTGEVKKQRPADGTFYQPGMSHHRCHRNKATTRFILTSRAGVEFVDLESGEATPNHWVRGACQYGVVPCNGLLYAPPHSCACFIKSKLSGFNALAPARQAEPAGPAGPRLERGPAYEAAAMSAAGQPTGDWPTLRHDASRSGYTSATVPPTLKAGWEANLGAKVSSLVAAEGTVFVACPDTHAVYALNANDGRLVWSFTAGSRVDSPPTIWNGLALFGCADGWVYCLRASDGALAWRFRAAPDDRRVVAYEQLESVWPVPGSVLVRDDVAYCVAGRSSYLDGGMYLVRLDPRTGNLLSETPISSRDPSTGRQPGAAVKGFDLLGGLPDVLSSDGNAVFMRHLQFDLNGQVQQGAVPHLFSPAGFLDGSWWHRAYWVYGTDFLSGWGGWWQVGNRTPSGKILCFDESMVYGFRPPAFGNNGLWGDLASYQLFAIPKAFKPQPGAEKGKQPAGQVVLKYQWVQRVPFVVRAMAVAGKTLFLAGPPVLTDENDLVSALEGQKGGVLWAVSTVDGQKLAEYPLNAPPVFDGMAAANGRIYLSTVGGKVVCMAG